MHSKYKVELLVRDSKAGTYQAPALLSDIFLIFGDKGYEVVGDIKK